MPPKRSPSSNGARTRRSPVSKGKSGHGSGSSNSPSQSDDDFSSPSQSGDDVSSTTDILLPPTLATLTATQDEAEVIMEGIKSDSSKRNFKPMGFTNGDAPRYPTNVCYRNAVISMLLNIPAFSNLLTTYQTRQEKWQADPRHKPRYQAPMFASLVNLNRVYREDFRRGKQNRLTDAMNVFFQEFNRVRPSFTEDMGDNYWRQEDAEEFLSGLLDDIEAELDGNDVVVSNALRTLFSYGLVPRRYCINGCQVKRLPASTIARDKLRRFHIHWGLPAGQSHRTVQDALNASFVEAVDKEDCPICKEKLWKVERFAKLPKILLTAFNRVVQGRNPTKDTTDCPLLLTYLPDTEKGFQQSGKYRLAGVVSHMGRTAVCGHYISYVPNHAKPGEWYCLDDAKVKRIQCEDNNTFISGWEDDPGAEMLPFLTAWELIDESMDQQQSAGNQPSAAEQRANDLQERMLKTREKEIESTEKEYIRREGVRRGKAVNNYNRHDRLLQLERSLKEREALLEQREKQPSSEESEADAEGRTEQEVAQSIDTATFCATFRNRDDHAESGRAIFKLRNFNPDVATKIESTVQLSDLDGDLRVIKKGTAVADAFNITFNIKGGRKRKRAEGDEEGGDQPAPALAVVAPRVKKVKKAKGVEKRGRNQASVVMPRRSPRVVKGKKRWNSL